MKPHRILAVMAIFASVAIAGNEARAVTASPPTCLASEAMCTRCAEYEGPAGAGDHLGASNVSGYRGAPVTYLIGSCPPAVLRNEKKQMRRSLSLGEAL